MVQTSSQVIAATATCEHINTTSGLPASLLACLHACTVQAEQLCTLQSLVTVQGHSVEVFAHHIATSRHRGCCRELQDMRASLMRLDKIYHRHGIMPGAVRSSPAFENASKALQRLTLDNEAAAAVATGNWQAMEQILEVARSQNNPVVARRMEVIPPGFFCPNAWLANAHMIIHTSSRHPF